MYVLIVKPRLKKRLEKLGKKNPKQAEIIAKKSEKLILNPHHYKNLKQPLQQFKCVHVDKHFVLIYSVDEANKTVILEDFDHHDKIYKKPISRPAA